MLPKQLKALGLPAKDLITGLEGVVTGVYFDLYGCAETILQPKIDSKGAVPTPRIMDYNRLKFLGSAPIMEPPKFSTDPAKVPPQLANLGRLGIETVTGFKGICSSVGFLLVGCVFATLTPPSTADGTVPENEHFDIHRVEFSGEPVMEVPDFSEEPQSPPDVTKKPHGPVNYERPKPL